MVKFLKVTVTSYDCFTEEHRSERLFLPFQGGSLVFESGILAERESIVQVRLGARKRNKNFGSQSRPIVHAYLPPGNFMVQLILG